MTSNYLAIAHEARKLSLKGKSNPEIKVALKFSYSTDVVRAVECARLDAGFDEPRLSDDETALILAVARAERSAVAKGDARAPQLKYCAGGYFWPRSRSAYLAYKRLGSHRKGEDLHRPGTGLGLLHPYSGYVRLTRAGWALVHAIEAKGDAA
ncbi:MAG: hypothetical protein K2Q27_02660 [Novosphingobium sp.]|uniref:hypothetical protein n=1 Tax=Novosphingobium sp. NDB2Meth1 TaxID=1892847 RepID=UPI000930E406|nr:hypothetical protein [Novosphingobium sp. NDB2Meth1]MBY0392149.1 hypothetical protein [Novosphingobium sp.]